MGWIAANGKKAGPAGSRGVGEPGAHRSLQGRMARASGLDGAGLRAGWRGPQGRMVAMAASTVPVVLLRRTSLPRLRMVPDAAWPRVPVGRQSQAAPERRWNSAEMAGPSHGQRCRLRLPAIAASWGCGFLGLRLPGVAASWGRGVAASTPAPAATPVTRSRRQRRRRNRLDGTLSRPEPARWSIEPVRTRVVLGRQERMRSTGSEVPSPGSPEKTAPTSQRAGEG